MIQLFPVRNIRMNQLIIFQLLDPRLSFIRVTHHMGKDIFIGILPNRCSILCDHSLCQHLSRPGVNRSAGIFLGEDALLGIVAVVKQRFLIGGHIICQIPDHPGKHCKHQQAAQIEFTVHLPFIPFLLFVFFSFFFAFQFEAPHHTARQKRLL